MQHINGKYTQWHNRKRGNDGTLFRGRYKSVLVDEDSYLLKLSRYIYRNPLEVKTENDRATRRLCLMSFL